MKARRKENYRHGRENGNQMKRKRIKKKIGNQ